MDAIKAGRSYITDIGDEELQQSGDPESDFGRQSTCRKSRNLDAISICVPTPLRKTQGSRHVLYRFGSRRDCQSLRPGQLIILESTTYPGTTEEIVLPVLEASGLKVGRGLFSGLFAGTRRSGKSGLQHEGHSESRRWRHSALRAGSRRCSTARHENIVVVSSTRVAEMVKLLENTFRSVNIALSTKSR